MGKTKHQVLLPKTPNSCTVKEYKQTPDKIIKCNDQFGFSAANSHAKQHEKLKQCTTKQQSMLAACQSLTNQTCLQNCMHQNSSSHRVQGLLLTTGTKRSVYKRPRVSKSCTTCLAQSSPILPWRSGRWRRSNHCPCPCQAGDDSIQHHQDCSQAGDEHIQVILQP